MPRRHCSRSQGRVAAAGARGFDGTDDIPTYGAATKFLCDRSLSRLCRWMRVLGIDTKVPLARLEMLSLAL